MSQDDSSLLALLLSFLALIIASAYFSSSETGMMSLNRYRLRHLARSNHAGAKRASKLLESPDKLIGVILIGNNFVNFLAASIATSIAIALFGDPSPILTAAPPITGCCSAICNSIELDLPKSSPCVII